MRGQQLFGLWENKQHSAIYNVPLSARFNEIYLLKKSYANLSHLLNDVWMVIKLVKKIQVKRFYEIIKDQKNLFLGI